MRSLGRSRGRASSSPPSNKATPKASRLLLGLLGLLGLLRLFRLLRLLRLLALGLLLRLLRLLTNQPHGIKIRHASQVVVKRC